MRMASLRAEDLNAATLPFPSPSVDKLKEGMYVTILNGKVDMHRGNMRLGVSRTGSIEPAPDTDFEVKVRGETVSPTAVGTAAVLDHVWGL